MSTRTSLLSCLATMTLFVAAGASAETIDMNDPRRAVGLVTERLHPNICM